MKSLSSQSSTAGFLSFTLLLVAVFPASVSAFTIPHGLFLNGGQSGVLPEALDHPSVAGMLILREWGDIETSPGVFDWTVVDERVQQAADSGKQVRLALHSGGDGVPGWINDMLDVDGGSIVSLEATKRGDTLAIPAFWDSDFLVHKNNFYQKMAERYASHPTVVGLSVSIADPFTGDWGAHGVDAQYVVDAGYNSLDFAGKWRDLVRTVMVAAPDRVVTTAVGSTPCEWINPSEDRFFAFETAMSLMAADPAIDMARLAGGKGSLMPLRRTPPIRALFSRMTCEIGKPFMRSSILTEVLGSAKRFGV